MRPPWAQACPSRPNPKPNPDPNPDPDPDPNPKPKPNPTPNPTVVPGLPILNILRTDLINTGDEIQSIEGIFSGTLSYLFNLVRVRG